MKTIALFAYLIFSISVIFYLSSQKSDHNQAHEIETVSKKYKAENDLLIHKMNELNSHISFLEQSIPAFQKRYLKVKMVRSVVEKNIKNTNQNFFKSDREFNDYILSVVEYSEQYNVPISLILSISRIESNFNPRAVSGARAQGIMQIMPDTMSFCAKSLKKETYDTFYVRDNTQCGVYYLSQLKNIFKSNNNFIIQGYNVGPSFILKFNGENLPQETYDYHIKVVDLLYAYQEVFYWEK